MTPLVKGARVRKQRYIADDSGKNKHRIKLYFKFRRQKSGMMKVYKLSSEKYSIDSDSIIDYAFLNLPESFSFMLRVV